MKKIIGIILAITMICSLGAIAKETSKTGNPVGPPKKLTKPAEKTFESIPKGKTTKATAVETAKVKGTIHLGDSTGATSKPVVAKPNPNGTTKKKK